FAVNIGCGDPEVRGDIAVHFNVRLPQQYVEILCAVDGEHYCNYAHRNPSALSGAWVQVCGVRDASLQIQKTDVYPLLAPVLDEVCGVQDTALHIQKTDVYPLLAPWPRPNVHVHANVRAHVDSHLSRQLVVLNAWLGAWGLERRQRTAKLIPGTYWSVFADDILVGELEYRAAPAGVRAVRIRGDLYPQDIYLCPTVSSPLREDS
ncbi:Galectin, partial [Operophtera brumata]